MMPSDLSDFAGPEKARRPEGPDDTEGRAESATSLGRMLQILDFITEERPVLTLEGISAEVGYSVSTSYRYVNELCKAGLLAAVGGGKYALGARVIELDLLARVTDPVVLASKPVVPDLMSRISTGVVMICELRGAQVVSVVAEKKPDSMPLNLERGKSMGLFRGSVSKAVLAHLPNRRLARLFRDYRDDIVAAGLGTTWKEFIHTIGTLRRQPWLASYGEFNRHNFSVSVPIFYGSGAVAGSLNYVIPLTERRDGLVEELARPLLAAAAEIDRKLAEVPAALPAMPSGDLR